LKYGLWQAGPDIQTNMAIKGEKVKTSHACGRKYRSQTTLVFQDIQPPAKVDEKQTCIDIIP
jgi:hypothetical protein